MVALNEARSVLSNAERRAAYDQARGPVPARPFGRAAPSEPDEHGTISAPPRGAAATGSSRSTLDFGRYAGWTLEALARRPTVPHGDLRALLRARLGGDSGGSEKLAAARAWVAPALAGSGCRLTPTEGSNHRPEGTGMAAASSTRT
jgi:curved DNA-binding protein CbpA